MTCFAAILSTSPRSIAHCPSNRMTPRRRRPEASFTSIGKLTLDLYTRSIDEIRAKNPQAVQEDCRSVGFSVRSANVMLRAADMALTALGDATFGDKSNPVRCRLRSGLLARMMKDENKARSAFAAMRPEQEKIVRAAPDFGPPVCILALIDAGLGRKEDALRESRRAVELVPLEKDALNGLDMIHYSGIVAAWVGEKDLALQNLAKAAQLPSFLSYGRLKLLPWY